MADRRNCTSFIAGTAFALTLSAAATARADAPVWSHEIVYTADVAGPVRGGAEGRGRFLDNLDVIVDGDLEAAVKWRGARLHAYVLNNSGGAPNDLAGTLQGVNNIEVSRARLRLYELWIEQSAPGGAGSVLAGLYDLNSEFYATDTSGLLIAPPFGIGSELAATGPAGPSIFPSTALAVRARANLGKGGYVQAAVLNARAAAVGDPGGPDTGFGDGVLMIGEAGVAGDGKLAAGAWRYSRRQPQWREPEQGIAQGGYVLAERRLAGDPDTGRSAAGFLRAGLAAGDTTPFSGAWQAGVLVTRLVAGRPDSALSLGVHQGFMNGQYRASLRDAGLRPAAAEAGIELTVADSFGRLTVQPDLQYVRRPNADRDAEAVVVAGLRLSLRLD